MDPIVHHASPGAIGQTPEANSEKSDSAPNFRWSFYEEVWYGKKIPIDMQPLMCRIDRTIQAITGLHGMLERDNRAVEWVRDNGSDNPSAMLGVCDREELHSAICLLLTSAGSTMEEIRDRVDSKWLVKGGAR